MPRQQFARRFDRFQQRLGEIFPQEVSAHLGDEVLPESFAAFFVDGFIASRSSASPTKNISPPPRMTGSSAGP